MVQYIYFVKCPNCEDEHFDFFDDAKAFALGCLGNKPIITQTEVCRNDFGECTDSADLGTVWSWEDMIKDTDEIPEVSVFSKDDLVSYDPDCDPEFDALDNSVDFDIDDVPDNFQNPIAAKNKELVTESFISKYDYNQMTKEELYSHLVEQGNTVEIAVGNQSNYRASFADNGVYSDSILEVEFKDELFSIVMWNYSDDGDTSEDADYEFSTKSFDELWKEIISFKPKALHEASNNAVLKATRAPKDSDYVIVSKHANGSYSFLGNNYRMTSQLDKAMSYSGKADAEYDIKYAEDQAEASSTNYDSYTSNPFFVTTFSEARKLLDDRAAYVKQRDEKATARSALGVEVRELARKMYKQGTACNTFEEFEAYMLENGYDKPTKYLYYSTYRNELMRCAKSQRKPIPEGMTIEQLVEEMEENEDTVECGWCNELFDKSECRFEVGDGSPDSGLGWLCSRCEAAIKSRGETLTFRENNYWDFLDEDVSLKEAATKWTCYFDDRELGVIDADNEEMALEKMQQVFPENNYGKYDGCFWVEPAEA